MKRKPVTTSTPQHFTEKELMQKPQPTHVVLKRGSKVNTFKLSDYDKETQRPASTDRR